MKVKIKGAIWAYVSDGKMSQHFSFANWQEKDAPNFIRICEHVIELDIPDDFDFRTPAIKAMREEQAKTRAEAQSKVNMIEEQIGKLLCIEMAEE